ncbi:PAS domain-containing protein [Hydrogenophaga crocea]|uniref:histidine kinase n=1 Tax=Hydrogenophaga crocea TaxID=2716225 RepID=A0A6G8IDJ5_9BURK|nr:PAS domain-containing protein [Hydrogenophaga crocea]QIM51171.1 PAS domain-containing protein [Hydrogenophaga crocea]
MREPGSSASPLPYEALFMASSIASAISSAHDGRLIEVNPAWEALFGTPRAQALGRTTLELGLWESSEVRAAFLRQMPGPLPPARLRNSAGEPLMVRMHVSTLASAGGPLLLVQITHAEREVQAETARERSEQALSALNRELQQRVELHTVIERTARVGHWTNAENAQEVVWSDGLYEIAGFTRDPGGRFTRAMGRSGIHPDDLPAWLALRERLDGSEIVFRWLRPDGQLRWFRTTMGQTTVKGNPQTDYGVVQDITSEREAAERRERLTRMLAAVTQAQAVFIEGQDRRHAFQGLLDAFLAVTGSEYGFVGEVLYDADDRPYLRTNAVTDISWDEASRQHYEAHRETGMEFRNLGTLFGHALRTGEPVIANDPANDPRRGGMPGGHRAMRAFLGVPLAVGERLVAMVGLANQPGGYTADDVGFLQPLLGALRQLVMAWREHEASQRTREQLEATSALLVDKSAALQDTLDSISQGLVKIGVDGRVRVYNRRFLELLDLPEAVVADHPLHDDVIRFQTARGDFGPGMGWVDPQAREYLELRSGADMPEHFWRRTRQGLTLEIRTLKLPDGGLVRTYTDVTSYIATQDALRAERQRLAWVLEATRPGIWETNLRERSMVVNERWAEMLGHTLAELQPVNYDTWYSRVHPEDRERAIALRNRHAAGELPFYECDIRMRHKDGHWVWINTRGRVHRRDEQGAALYMSGTHLDVSERVAAQEQIRALNAGLEQRVRERTAELERSMRDMEAISYSIAHDLRAPLRSVNGFAQVIEEEELQRLSASGREMFARISRSARNMGQMITDMLELLRVVQVDLEPRPVDMAALAHAVAEALGPQAPAARIEVCELPLAMGDATLLRQVLSNLVDNALKYSRQRADPRVQVGHDAVQGAYFVRDNGIGFDMARANKLFGLFQRLQAHSDVPGMGVGLAIVQRIVERHGGRVWAEAAPGQGATFWFRLPLA